MNRIPLFRPQLPTASAMLPYLERIDANRWYSNFGPLGDELEERLAHRYGVTKDRVVLVANGTQAISACIATAPASRGDVVPMPAWSFPATSFAAISAGFRPHLLDVDERTWALEPGAIPTRLAERARAVVPVAPFGAPPDIEPWCEWSEARQVPVVLDAAASFDSLAGLTLPDESSVAVAVSLHATKVLGVGEGAFVIAGDARWSKRVRQHINFGFLGARRSDAVGTNAKLSEYSAAVGLAGLDAWPITRRRWIAVTDAYSRRLAATKLPANPGFGTGIVAPYCVVDFGQPDRCAVAIAALTEHAIETRRWWGGGQHRNPALGDVDRSNTRVTDDLASRTLGIPFWLDIGPEQIDAIFGLLDILPW